MNPTPTPFYTYTDDNGKSYVFRKPSVSELDRAIAKMAKKSNQYRHFFLRIVHCRESKKHMARVGCRTARRDHHSAKCYHREIRFSVSLN